MKNKTKKQIGEILFGYIGETNDKITRKKIVNSLNKLMETYVFEDKTSSELAGAGSLYFRGIDPVSKKVMCITWEIPTIKIKAKKQK